MTNDKQSPFQKSSQTKAGDDSAPNVRLEPVINPLMPPPASVLRSLNEQRESGIGRSVHPALIQVDRYKIINLIGSGGFGRVYLATDTVLTRRVAVKVFRDGCVNTPADIERYLQEARLAAGLKHPNIVSIYDAGYTNDGYCYVVSEYIDGVDLAEYASKVRLSVAEAVEIIRHVGQALVHAHGHGLIHRDVKPQNIMIARNGKPYLVDFGLALQSDVVTGTLVPIGTPGYASPEQLRRESHLVDERSDVFSLGVVLYELLTHTRVFPGKAEEAVAATLRCDVTPPSHIESAVHAGLDRLCLKAISLKASDRYRTVSSLLRDLEAIGNQSNATGRGKSDEHLVFTPKGLRSFDESDSAMYLRLLPGPHNAEGYPRCVAFWLRRFSPQNTTGTMRVGVITGPSGSGKSSIIRAGILPHIHEDVRSIYISCTANDTEKDLLSALHSEVSGLGEDWDTVRVVQAVRSGELNTGFRRVLVVLDQFEQWLHANPVDSECELVRFLRQCDGANFQVLICVRHEFWVHLGRLLSHADIRLSENKNLVMMDAFEKQHAAQVLYWFGVSTGRLLCNEAHLVVESKAMANRIVGELAVDERVSPVSLSQFVLLMGTRDWTSEAIEEMGGLSGLGLRIIDKTIGRNSPSETVRVNQQITRLLVESMVAGPQTEIRTNVFLVGGMCDKFDGVYSKELIESLLDELDRSLHVITAVAGESCQTSHCVRDRRYQLAHDSYVPLLREWLALEDEATRAGRTRRLLRERAEFWSDTGDQRFLPSFGEYVRIMLLTVSERRSLLQREFLHHGLAKIAKRLSTIAVMITISVVIGFIAMQRADLERQVDLLFQVPVGLVPSVLDEIIERADELPDDIRSIATDVTSAAEERLRALLVVMHYDPTVTPDIVPLLLNEGPEMIRAGIESIRRAGLDIKGELVSSLGAESGETLTQRLRAASALSLLDADMPEVWRVNRVAVVKWLMDVPIEEVPDWAALLRGNRHYLDTELRGYYSAEDDGDVQVKAAIALTTLYKDTPEHLVELLEGATPQQMTILIGMGITVGAIRSEYLDHSKTVAETSLAGTLGALDDITIANVSIALAAEGDYQHLWSMLIGDYGIEARSEGIHRVAASGFALDVLIAKLSDSGSRDDLCMPILMIFSLRDPHSFSPQVSRQLIQIAGELFQYHPDSGVHLTSRLLLQRLGADSVVLAAERDFYNIPYSDNRNWHINPIGQTMVKVKGKRMIQMRRSLSRNITSNLSIILSPAQEISIEHNFLISSTELTLGQATHILAKCDPSFVASDWDGPIPATRLDAREIAIICSYLTSIDPDIPNSDNCYQPYEQIVGQNDWQPVDGFERKAGYRPPTVAEWLLASNASDDHYWFFGSNHRIRLDYSWIADNAKGRLKHVATKLPNPLGLFDMDGNSNEVAYAWMADNTSESVEMILDTGSGRFAAMGGNAGTSRGSATAADFVVRQLSPGLNTSTGVMSSTGLRLVRTLPHVLREN